jgi:hypothetical protein
METRRGSAEIAFRGPEKGKKAALYIDEAVCIIASAAAT